MRWFPCETAGPEHILLAVDNADMREYVSHLLAPRWEVEVVSHGQVAIDAARRRKPDLVLADIMMPVRGGMGLLSAMRHDPELRDVPAILLSARAGEEAHVEALKAGADDYLIKPFSARELIASVSSSLALARSRAAELATVSRLYELSRRLTATSDFPTLLREVLAAAMELQNADFGTIQLYDTESNALVITAQHGFEQEFLDYFRSVNAEDGTACSRALKDRSRIVVEDVNVDPESKPHLAIMAAAGVRAVQSTPLFDRVNGEPLGMLSTHFRDPHHPSAHELRLIDLYANQAADVIAFRVTEQRLRKSEARLQAAIDLVCVSPYSWDPVTGALQWDDRLRRMWGLPPGARVDMEVWRAAIHPDDLQRVEAAVAACIDPSGNGVYYIDYRVIGVIDRVERWVSTYGRTVFDESRRAVAFHGAALEITGRKRAEQRLRESEEHFRQFAEHSTNALWLLDVQRERYEFISAAADQVWGSSVEAVLGDRRSLKIVHPEDRERVAAAFEQVVREGRALVPEYRIVRPDGRIRRIRETIFPIRDEQGRVGRVGGIAQDITKYNGYLVYVIDADEAARRSTSLTLQGVGYDVKAFASASVFLDLVPALMAGCILVDLHALGAGGLIIPQVLDARPVRLPVIVLGDSDSDPTLPVRAMKAGAVDFLRLPYDREALLTAIASAHADIQESADRDSAAQVTRRRIAEMSLRERQVLDRMLHGGTKRIARELGISPRTVETHRARVMERLGAKTLTEFVLLVTEAGLRSSKGSG